jgi:hypothetical protein
MFNKKIFLKKLELLKKLKNQKKPIFKLPKLKNLKKLENTITKFDNNLNKLNKKKILKFDNNDIKKKSSSSSSTDSSPVTKIGFAIAIYEGPVDISLDSTTYPYDIDYISLIISAANQSTAFFGGIPYILSNNLYLLTSYNFASGYGINEPSTITLLYTSTSTSTSTTQVELNFTSNGDFISSDPSYNFSIIEVINTSEPNTQAVPAGSIYMQTSNQINTESSGTSSTYTTSPYTCGTLTIPVSQYSSSPNPSQSDDGTNYSTFYAPPGACFYTVQDTDSTQTVLYNKIINTYVGGDYANNGSTINCTSQGVNNNGSIIYANAGGGNINPTLQIPQYCIGNSSDTSTGYGIITAYTSADGSMYLPYSTQPTVMGEYTYTYTNP